MSTEEARSSRQGVAHQAGRLRALATALGLGGSSLLAGCSSGPEPATTTASGSADTQTPDPMAGATEPTATTPPSPTATPTPTLSTAECRERAEELDAELATVREAVDTLEADVAELERRQEVLGQTATLFEPPPADVVAAAEAVGTAAREAVVFLEFPNGAATGWYVDDHHVVTNAHNVYDHHRGTERTPTAWTLGGDSYETTIVDYVSSLLPDVAVLRTDEAAPATLPTGTNPERGSSPHLVQVGHPGGIGHWMLALGKLRRYQEFQTEDGGAFAELQTTVPGRQGVSGSPVLNLDGEVVGLTYAGSPIRSKQPDEQPLVADEVAYDRPIASLSWGGHVAIDTVMPYYEEWT